MKIASGAGNEVIGSKARDPRDPGQHDCKESAFVLVLSKRRLFSKRWPIVASARTCE